MSIEKLQHAFATCCGDAPRNIFLDARTLKKQAGKAIPPRRRMGRYLFPDCQKL